MGQLARAATTKAIARPLAVLVPLIQDELSEGNKAGLEHYLHAGEMLLEARDQVASFKWGTWLSKHFTLSRRTAYNYMKLAERVREEPELVHTGAQTLFSIARPTEKRARDAWARVSKATRKVNVDTFAEAERARADEVELHRSLALKLIDIGYKALATRLHSDRGGSDDAMRRLIRVRDELKKVAKTRRFEP